jgi:HD-like signal output (HDOD) protein
MPHNISDVAEPAVPTPSSAFPIDPNLETDTVSIQVKLCNLPPFHPVANKVLSLSSDPKVDLQKLSSLVETDPAFAAEVLFLANSSLFGFSSRLKVLRHAVAILGMDRIKALAVTVAMRAFLSTGNSMVAPCWRHSAASAMAAEEIAPLFEIAPERAYTICLMHDIGRLGLLKSYSADMSTVLKGEYDHTDDVLKAEREAVSVDHGVAGSWLVKYWELPDEFAGICAAHHEPLSLSDSPLLQTAKMACRVADALDYSVVKYKSPAPFANVVKLLPPQLQRKFPAEADLRRNIENRLRVLEA